MGKTELLTMTQVASNASNIAGRPIVTTMIDVSAHAPAGAAGADGLIDLATIDLGVICPMASESETAIRFVDAVLSHCRGRGFKSVSFFIVLDNACKDNTRELLAEHGKNNPELHVVWAPENKGVRDA